MLVPSSNHRRPLAMEVIFLTFRDHRGRNLDDPRLVDALVESARSPYLFCVFPANRKAFSTTLECFLSRLLHVTPKNCKYRLYRVNIPA